MTYIIDNQMHKRKINELLMKENANTHTEAVGKCCDSDL